jgi:hypothetical protein
MLTWPKRDELYGRPYRTMPGGTLEPDLAWEGENLVTVRVRGSEFRCHRRVRTAFYALLDAWQLAGLLPLVRTFDRFHEFATVLEGSRMKRHCHGHAFDINSRWNPIGRPAHDGEGGTLRLLPIARDLGWFCGADRGNVAKHFELERP